MDNDELIKYNGNEEEFNKYRKELNESNLDYSNKRNNYIGEKVNGLFEGRGILYNEKGTIMYNGNFKKGKYEGFGKIYEKGILIYEGFFKEGLYSGKGILNKKNKKIYEGYFINNKYDGIGIEYLLNGNRRRKAFYSKGYICNQCNGIIYNEKNEEIYIGLLRDGIPKEGKSLSIYYDEENILYKGDFISFKYDGKGILYYANNNKMKYNGIFKEGNFIKGILYDITGYKQYEGDFKDNKYEGIGVLYYNKSMKVHSKGSFKEGEIINGILYDIDGKKIIYEGEIRNNMPKEGKNLKLYKLNGYLRYEGDIFDYSYHGNGKIYEESEYQNNLVFDGIFNKGNKVKGILYEDKRKKYEGEFKNDKFNGFGKFYVLDEEDNNYLYYEGNFVDMEISGKGVKYYKNGDKKIEGKFEDIYTVDGTYYNPHGGIIFEGKISHKTPFNCNQSSLIYNDNGDFIQNDKDYENEVSKIDNNKKEVIDYTNSSNVGLISDGFPGKTYILNRIVKNIYSETFLATIGIDKEILYYKYKNEIIRMTIWDTSGNERFRPLPHKYYQNSDVIIYVF